MPKERDWPIEQIRKWIEDEKRTQRWVGEQVGSPGSVIAKVCRRHGIRTQPRGPRIGPDHPDWKGGRRVDKSGYFLTWVEGHPSLAGKTRRGTPRRSGYVREHRLVMERMLGRYLDPKEVVHHKNGDKQDNRPENLELYTTNAQHLRDELTGRCPKWSEEGKERIRAGRAGVPMPESAKETLRQKATGRRASPEARAKMSASQTGRKHTEATKEKIRAANQRRTTNPKGSEHGEPPSP